MFKWDIVCKAVYMEYLMLLGGIFSKKNMFLGHGDLVMVLNCGYFHILSGLVYYGAFFDFFKRNQELKNKNKKESKIRNYFLAIITSSTHCSILVPFSQKNISAEIFCPPYFPLIVLLPFNLASFYHTVKTALSSSFLSVHTISSMHFLTFF